MTRKQCSEEDPAEETIGDGVAEQELRRETGEKKRLEEYKHAKIPVAGTVQGQGEAERGTDKRFGHEAGA